MGVYLGYVLSMKLGFFFKPVAELRNSGIAIMMPEDIRNLLPASKYENILLDCSEEHKTTVDEYCRGNSLIVFEFDTDELEANCVHVSNGVRQIGYKVDFMKFVGNRKIRRIQDENLLINSAKELANMNTTDAAAKIANLTAELDTVRNKLSQYGKINDLNQEIYHLERTIEDLKNKRNEHERNVRDAKNQLDNLFRDTNKRMADIAFNGFMANKMLDAAAKADSQNLDELDNAIVAKVSSIDTADKSPADLKDYLCYMIGLVRPNYSEEDILNIAICLTQNFLTVFYGEPGCGKTSICNIFAEVLGLNKIAATIDDARAGRYVPVSVEKGWTSKRDFVGYYNPLSKTFDKSNRRIYDALRLLNLEGASSNLPFVILLDEANLSPMEYYWSDFMNLCDGLDDNSTVNLGEDYIYKIPRTLRFVATINNDHTTEELSPRLIDRAWIITLPEVSAANLNDADKIPAAEVEIISWNALRDAFNPPDFDDKFFPAGIYGTVVDKLKDANISVSPRASKAIARYCNAAARFFDKTTALDYAVAQKILPKIHGNDDSFRNWLDEFRKICTANKLNKSAEIVKKIIERGDANMGYYRFFA